MPLKCMIHLLYGMEKRGGEQERETDRQTQTEREQIQSERWSMAEKGLGSGS